MKVRQHKNGTYSIVNLTKRDVRDLERAVFLDYSQWTKSGGATYVPSQYNGWTLEVYIEINKEIAARMLEIANILKPIAFPPDRH